MMMKRLVLSLFLLVNGSALYGQDAPLPARVAAMKMTLPDGFKATLFAGEPDVVQPIAFTFDDRGRVWVAECLSYPKWQTDPKLGKDRIVILEDTDGDGVHDKRSVFADNIANISGINYGFGGVWVCATPNLLFIPIKDDKPAGPPQVVLDGWDIKARHNVFNSLTWGPDGWLYGCNGILSNSKVGAPGTPAKDRTEMNCGVWRYHPTKKKFEVVAHGTTNPWGLDFDEHGEMFITNCVIDHLWHIVPGGHYQRMFGNDLNPHLYKLMPSICDHIHWGGGAWTSSRAPIDPKRASGVSRGSDAETSYRVHSEAGGGHAHSGCMIYLGDNWPARYRNGVFMCNIHGNRINHDILERNGSTYVARHAKDFMHANDPWFRGLALHYGPDGGVYVADWTDTGECHNYEVAHKTTGRIFKITYDPSNRKSAPIEDLAKLSDEKLAQLHSHFKSENEWYVRHIRRILQERSMQRKIDSAAIKVLEEHLQHAYFLKHLRLHTLWTLHVIGHLDKDKLCHLLDDPDENIRAWAVRLLLEEPKADDRLVEGLSKRAQQDSSLVKLHLAGALQRLDHKTRAKVGLELLMRDGDSSDPHLPLMYWYAVESSIGSDGDDMFSLLSRGKIPLVREFIARRTSNLKQASGKGRRIPYETVIYQLELGDAASHRDILRGLQEGLAGKRSIVMPAGWTGVFPDLVESPLPEVRERALALAVQFGDERAFTLLRKIVPDRALSTRQREDALKTLLFQQKADLVPILHELLQDDALRGPAIRGLAAFDHPQTPILLLKAYPKWKADEKSDAIQTLSARGSYALALLDALDTKTIPRGDVNSYTIRQLQALKHPDLSAKLTKVIGEVRPASADKTKLMAKYKAELKPDVLKKANVSNGRALYNKACASCHRLFGEGGDIGPDLTGSQRSNLDYILDNVLDPSAIVPREYQVTVVVTTGGRTLSGIVKKESDAALTLQTANDVVVVPKSEIDSRTATKVSMMPDGAFEQMRIEEVRDLVGYLMGGGQVALKK
jgi:putative membrane-bound dehydrogenase-like protein